MPYDRVIVFGPTGNIGAVAAQTAHSLGAHVALALRTLDKPIRGLDSAAEKSGKYTRVQADFGNNDAITAAVKQTQSRAAFVYVDHGNSDHQLSFFQALKAGGVEFVVFLSSFTVQGDLDKIQPADFISFLHAQAELSLIKVFGDNYVAVRPGGFATNTLREKSQILEGRVKLFHPENEMDYITPDDMGEVIGNILVKGPQDGQKNVYIFGASLISATETYKAIGDALGKPVEIDEIPDVETATQLLISQGIPPPIAKYLSETGEQTAKGGLPFELNEKWVAEGRANTEKYAGRPPQKFADWVASNKDLYLK